MFGDISLLSLIATYSCCWLTELLYLEDHPKPVCSASMNSSLSLWFSNKLISFSSMYESPITFPLFRINVTLEFDALPSLSAMESALLFCCSESTSSIYSTSSDACFSNWSKIYSSNVFVKSLSAMMYEIVILIDNDKNINKKIRVLIPINYSGVLENL